MGVVVSTPQNIALADARKGIAMFQQENINVPVLGVIENMAYLPPKSFHKYYLFSGALAEDKQVPSLEKCPLFKVFARLEMLVDRRASKTKQKLQRHLWKSREIR